MTCPNENRRSRRYRQKGFEIGNEMRLNELRAIGGGESGHAFFQKIDLESILEKNIVVTPLVATITIF